MQSCPHVSMLISSWHLRKVWSFKGSASHLWWSLCMWLGYWCLSVQVALDIHMWTVGKIFIEINIQKLTCLHVSGFQHAQCFCLHGQLIDSTHYWKQYACSGDGGEGHLPCICCTAEASKLRKFIHRARSYLCLQKYLKQYWNSCI